jgi:hypothetical protein
MFLYKSYIFYMDLISKWTKYNIGRILWKNEQKCFSSENTNLIETQTCTTHLSLYHSPEPVPLIWVYHSPESVPLIWVCTTHMSLYHSPESVPLTWVCTTHLVSNDHICIVWVSIRFVFSEEKHFCSFFHRINHIGKIT